MPGIYFIASCGPIVFKYVYVVRGQDEDSNKYAEFRMQFALKIYYFYVKIDEQAQTRNPSYRPVTNGQVTEKINHLNKRRINSAGSAFWHVGI